MRVTANDNILDAEDADGVLNCRRFSADSRTMRRDNVSGVAKDKKITGAGIGQQSRINARIGAGDEQCFGVLAFCQSLK